MIPAPRLSICIPTHNREFTLRDAIQGAVAEARAVGGGLVEVVVSDNGSTDGSLAIIEACARDYPIRWFRFDDNREFDTNYLNCLEQAAGEFVWVVGDDDMVLPGAVARIFQALDAGADACLCAAQEVDKNLNPLEVRTWFLEPTESRVFHLDGPESLAEYFDRLRFMGGAFAFISVAVFRRERFLAGRAFFEQGMGSHYIHAWGMAGYLRTPTELHWIAEPLIRNGVDNDVFGQTQPFFRLLHDLDGWIRVADATYGENSDLRARFLKVLARNHQDQMVRTLRFSSGNFTGWWPVARGRLLEVGYDPLLVSTVEFTFALCNLTIPPPTGLDPAGLCLADLPLVTRGARRIAVLALGSDADLLAGSGLLSALRTETRAEAVRILCPAELAPLLDGFDLQVIDLKRLGHEPGYLEAQVAALAGFGAELLVNLDRARNARGDLFASSVRPIGALAFRADVPEGWTGPTWRFLGEFYRGQLDPSAPAEDLAAALGLPEHPLQLWLETGPREEAAAILAPLGDDPGPVLALLGGGEPADPALLARALEAGWCAIALGDMPDFGRLDDALEPFGLERGLNLAGALTLATQAALLERCAGFLGGSGKFRQLAACAGCAPLCP